MWERVGAGELGTRKGQWNSGKESGLRPSRCRGRTISNLTIAAIDCRGYRP